MTTKTKTTARERLINFAHAQGWELNPLRTIWEWDTAPDTRVQHPTAFRKSDGEGGFWEIELDYSLATSFGEGNRLRVVRIGHRDAEGNLQAIGSRESDSTVPLSADYADGWPGSLSANLWAVTSGVTGTNTLRGRAELLLANLPLALWLAEEAVYQRRERVAAERRARQEREALRQRPLDITVDRNEWNTLVSKLDQASRTLRWADGLTDLPQTLAELEEAVANIRAVVRNARVDVVG